MRQRGERLLLGPGRLDLVAGAAQHDLQAADDLRLVVDDQDARGRAHRDRLAAAGRDREADRERGAPRPRPDCSTIRPPLASTKPRQIASPRPEPGAGRSPRPRKNGSNTCARCCGGIPRPLVDHADRDALRRSRRR